MRSDREALDRCYTLRCTYFLKVVCCMMYRCTKVYTKVCVCVWIGLCTTVELR